jgi:kinesin family member C1
MDSRPVNKSRIPQAGLAEMNSGKMNSLSGLKPPGFATSAMKPPTIPSSSSNHCLGQLISLIDLTEAPTATKAPHQPSSSTSRIPNGTARPHGRANSLSSSASSRATQSRTTSTSSFSQTVGSSSRTIGSRPQTSMAQRKHGASSIARPHTALETHEEESPSTVLGKRKGMQNSPGTFQVTPGSYDKHLNCTMTWTPSPSSSHTPDGLPTTRRDSSLNTHTSKLSLVEPMDPPNDQVPPRKGMCKVPSHSTITKSPLLQSKSTLSSLSPSRHKFKSPQKATPPIVPFLTKSSHLKAWDHDTRMQELEDIASVLFNRMSQAGQNSDTMKDAVNLYKSRGRTNGCPHLGDSR